MSGSLVIKTDNQSKINDEFRRECLQTMKIDTQCLSEIITNEIIGRLFKYLMKETPFDDNQASRQLSSSIIEGKTLDMNESFDNVLDLGTCSFELKRNNTSCPLLTTKIHRRSPRKKSKKKNDPVKQKRKSEISDFQQNIKYYNDSDYKLIMETKLQRNLILEIVVDLR